MAERDSRGLDLRAASWGFAGLSTEEVRRRRARGEVNRVVVPTSRPARAIVIGNLITLYNAILAGAVVLLLALDQFRDAALIGGLVAFTVVVSTAQELRAKWRLDRIALLAQPRVPVLREGREVTLRPDDVVLGDHLVLVPGVQVVADGALVLAEHLEMDESLLTGESSPVPKLVGERVWSGSYCLSGRGVYVAERVGEASAVHALTALARRHRVVRTPLQRLVDGVLRVLLVAVVGLSALQIVVFTARGTPLLEAARATAVIATLVPQGLLLMSTVAYSLGALRAARRHGLVQRLSAVESLSHVDVLCMDKTGTLTTARLSLHEVVPLGEGLERVRELVGAFAASSPVANATVRAIAAALPAAPCPVLADVPFRPELGWSALALGPPCAVGTFVLGAPEALLPHVVGAPPLTEEVRRRAAAGQRVLLFAAAPSLEALRAPDGAPRLSAGLRPLALIALQEELRPGARRVVRALLDEGIALKIVSGDHPETALALARRAGVPVARPPLTGSEVAGRPMGDVARVVEQGVVFGRVLPHQKQAIVRALKVRGHVVAFVGDGTNDIPAMKEADLSLAVESGTPATRGVADVVLLADDFDVLPAMLREGRRVVGSMLLLIQLFVTRDVATVVLILGTQALGLPFPLLPPHVTVVALLTVGVPALFLVGRGRPARFRRGAAARIARFVFPVGGAAGLAALSTFLVAALGLEVGTGQARSATVAAAVLAGLVVVLLLGRPPGAALSDVLRRRDLLTLLGLEVLVLLGVFAVPSVRGYLEIEALAPSLWLVVLVAVAVWMGGLVVVARLGPRDGWLADDGVDRESGEIADGSG